MSRNIRAAVMAALLGMTPLPSMALSPFNASAAGTGVQRFCTMATAVQQLLDKADIPEKLQKEPVVRRMAEDLIARKLAAAPGDTVKLVWKDIYDMRGGVNAWLAQNGHPFNYVGQAIDAAGSGLTGTVAGRVLMLNALTLAGPAGFIMLGGLNIVQETFQCDPSGVIMAADAGATVVVLLPWCKLPGVNKGCVAMGSGIEHGVQRAAAGIFGKEVSAAFVARTANGVVTAIKFKTADLVMTGMELLNYLDGRAGLRTVELELSPADAAPGAFALPQAPREIKWD